MRKIIKFFLQKLILILWLNLFFIISLHRENEIDARLHYYFIKIQEKLLINIMPTVQTKKI